MLQVLPMGTITYHSKITCKNCRPAPTRLNTLVIVEGKYDHAFLSKAIRLLDPKSEILVAYLELLDEHSSGGVDDVRKYLQANVNVIRVRVPQAPVIVILARVSYLHVYAEVFHLILQPDRTRFLSLP